MFIHRLTITVHPHGRGDDLRVDNRYFYHLRFTPTGVGTTSMASAIFTTRTVHPHGRGDDQPVAPVRPLATRFTPTGVGTTLAPTAAEKASTVHPHGRGDDQLSKMYLR